MDKSAELTVVSICIMSNMKDVMYLLYLFVLTLSD